MPVLSGITNRARRSGIGSILGDGHVVCMKSRYKITFSMSQRLCYIETWPYLFYFQSEYNLGTPRYCTKFTKITFPRMYISPCTGLCSKNCIAGIFVPVSFFARFCASHVSTKFKTVQNLKQCLRMQCCARVYTTLKYNNFCRCDRRAGYSLKYLNSVDTTFRDEPLAKSGSRTRFSNIGRKGNIWGIGQENSHSAGFQNMLHMYHGLQKC